MKFGISFNLSLKEQKFKGEGRSKKRIFRLIVIIIILLFDRYYCFAKHSKIPLPYHTKGADP